MTKSQAVNLLPWKIAVWFPKVIDELTKMKNNLVSVCSGDKEIHELLFPR